VNAIRASRALESAGFPGAAAKGELDPKTWKAVMLAPALTVFPKNLRLVNDMV
jgi:hypothetical protein